MTASEVDVSAWSGMINLCAGSTTPLNSRLGGEESDPDARAIAVRGFCFSAGFWQPAS